MDKFLRIVLATSSLVFASFCSVAPGSASVIEYTDMASFNTAASGVSTYNFEGIAPAGGTVYGNFTVGGVTFDSNYGGTVIDANAGAAYPNYGSSYLSGYDAQALLATGATAIGFSYAYLWNLTSYGVEIFSGQQPFANYLGGSALVAPLPGGNPTNFVGFISDTPITSVFFPDAGPTESFDITQFEVGAGFPVGSPVPEPSSIFLLGVGLAGLGLARRRANT